MAPRKAVAAPAPVVVASNSKAAAGRTGVVRWLAWSPVAAVAWAALSVGLVVSAGSLKGCDWTPLTPSGPAEPVRPPWLPPNPPPPPQPDPIPNGSAEPEWLWLPFAPESALYGFEAETAMLDGYRVMRHIRRIAPR